MYILYNIYSKEIQPASSNTVYNGQKYFLACGYHKPTLTNRSGHSGHQWRPERCFWPPAVGLSPDAVKAETAVEIASRWKWSWSNSTVIIDVISSLFSLWQNYRETNLKI